MPESMTESEKNHNDHAILGTDLSLAGDQHLAIPAEKLSASNQLIIWTPRFIVIFALLLVVGLGGASLLTQGWLNSYYQAPVPELLFDIFAFGCWERSLALSGRSSQLPIISLTCLCPLPRRGRWSPISMVQETFLCWVALSVSLSHIHRSAAGTRGSFALLR